MSHRSGGTTEAVKVSISEHAHIRGVFDSIGPKKLELKCISKSHERASNNYENGTFNDASAYHCGRVASM